MSIPKEPRQIMINLMYLVLTALLALNVSNEILHAFKVMNESINKSNVSIAEKNAVLYNQIKEDEGKPGQELKVRPYRLKSEEVKRMSDSMFNYLQQWKKRVMDAAGGETPEGLPIREDNIDATTLLLVDRGGGDTIKQKFIDLRNRYLNELDPADRKAIEGQLPLTVEKPKPSENNPQGDWKVEYFHSMPTMAAVALFAKFQNDVRNSEALVVERLFSEAHSSDIKFNELEAVATPQTTYALEGQKIDATILMAAYNKDLDPKVSSSEGHVTKTQDGVAYWETEAHGIGLKTVSGTVSLTTPSGVVEKPFKFQYTVGSTGASMQIDKMNVFYIGVDNPVTISAAGYSLQDVSINVPGATIKPGPALGQYIIRVTQAGDVEAVINAKTQSGAITKVGGLKVRVKYIPDPVAEVAGKTGGGMLANVFRAQLGVIAELKNFEFDARFLVFSFDFSMLPKRGEYIGPLPVVGSPLFSHNSDVKKIMAMAKPGDRIFIENIKARGPDGRPRTLSPILLTLH